MGLNGNQPSLIIKRRVVQPQDGRNPGAWKVAYADFATVMMAFFMLMWLLSATSEQQREGIADYFRPSAPVARMPDSVDRRAAEDRIIADPIATRTGPEGRQADAELGPDSFAPSAVAASEVHQAQLADLRAALEAGLAQHADRQLVLIPSDLGLAIEVFADDGTPLFDQTNGRATLWLQQLITMMVLLFETVENDVAIDAHVPSVPIVVRNSSLWDQTAARADQVRQLLVEGGLDPDRVMRVTGHADRSPAAQDPQNPRNDRIVVTLLRSD